MAAWVTEATEGTVLRRKWSVEPRVDRLQKREGFKCSHFISWHGGCWRPSKTCVSAAVQAEGRHSGLRPVEHGVEMETVTAGNSFHKFGLQGGREPLSVCSRLKLMGSSQQEKTQWQTEGMN